MTQTGPEPIAFFRRKRSSLAWLIALITGICFLAGVAPDVVPGESATLIAQHSGADPFAPLSHFIWGWLGNVMALLPFGTTGLRWNLLSVICGASACGVFFLLVTRLIGNRLDREIIVQNTVTMQNVAGFFSALLLGFSLPFRLVSTLAHPITFDLLILFTAIWLLIRFKESKSLMFAYGAVAMLGLAVTEYATSIIAVPVFGISILYFLWRNNQLRVLHVIKLLAVFVIGLTPYVIQAGLFLKEPAFRWAEMNGFAQVLWYIWRDQYMVIRYGLPKVGWFIVLLFSLLPMLLVVLQEKNAKISTKLLLLVTGALGFLLFFNIRFAPWPMFGFSPLLVMPYVIGAAWCGCLVVYGLGYFTTSWFFRRRQNRMPRLAPATNGTFLFLLAGILIAVAFTNYQRSDIRSSLVITRFADQVAEQIQDGQWLILDEQMEPLVRIKSAERNKSGLLISSSDFRFPPQQRALCEFLADQQLCNMVEMGLVPLIRERLHPGRSHYPVISWIGDPTPLRFAAGDVQPDRMFYTISSAIPDPDSFMNQQRDVWAGIGSELIRGAAIHDAHRQTKKRLLQLLSRTANDAGVWLEGQNRADLAMEAYRESARLFEENLSARLNLQKLLVPESDENKVLQEEIDLISASLQGRTSLPKIIEAYGMIRHAGSYMMDVNRWNQAGATRIAEQSLDKVRALENDDEAFNVMMASLSATRGDMSRGKELFSEAARISTNNAEAILGLSRIASAQGQTDLAKKLLQSIPRDDISEEWFQIEEAQIELAEGNREAARVKLEALDKSGVKDPRVWALLAIISAESRPADSDSYLSRIESMPNLPPPFLLPLARIYLARGNMKAAEEHLQELLRARPFDQDALYVMLRIRLRQGQLEYCMPLVRQLLTIDTRDALANYVLSSIYTKEGRNKEAEEALMISIASKPSPEAHNNLAYLLYLDGRYDEALPHAEASVKDAVYGAAWHTKALILVALGKNAEAADDVEKGLALSPDHPGLLSLKDEITP